MSTRSIIVVTGKAKYGDDRETYRLYKHCDGYPSGNLPIIAAALRRGCELVDNSNNGPGPCGVRLRLTPEVVTGLLTGEAVSVHGVGAEVEEHATGDWSLDVLGNQGDLEWIYVINVDTRTVNIYGRGEWKTNNTPQKMVKKGMTDPAEYLKHITAKYYEEVKQDIREAVEAVKATGYTINSDKCPLCGGKVKL